MNKSPLADRVRPLKIEDVVGQSHLLANGKILSNIIKSKNIPNMIFYGPSGTGKTTVANIISSKTGKPLYKLNATTASVSDIKKIANDLDSLLAPDGVLLYLDEIQNFNKKQQQSLLEFIETGKITLIASTTENPYFYIYNAILSRSNIFEFLPISSNNILIALKRAASILQNELKINLKIDESALTHISNVANGDVRKAINSLELAALGATPDKLGNLKIDLALAEQSTQKKALKYDKNGDSHYDILSAFQKSIRGSDPDASIHYLARLLSAGDMLSVCRRLMVIAAEDIGLAYPMAITITKSCVDCALQLGLPEARIPLAEAVLLLATAPKSNSVITAIDMAMGDIETKDTGDIPLTIKDTHYAGAKKLNRGGYKYPHSYPNNYIDQQYLPDSIKDVKYYTPGSNKNENAILNYWNKIKNNK